MISCSPRVPPSGRISARLAIEVGTIETMVGGSIARAFSNRGARLPATFGVNDLATSEGDVDFDENGDVEGDLVTWVAKGGAIVETGRVPPVK